MHKDYCTLVVFYKLDLEFIYIEMIEMKSIYVYLLY